MHNVLRMSRRAFTVAVVAATIAWSIGLAALVTPLTANAAASGDLVRGSLPAVYYVGADDKRYVFPNQPTYNTWYADFSAVQTITDAELAAMPIGGNVTYRPGVRMVKIQTDPKVYAVGMDGTLRWVADEATATCLYGADWNTKIDDVPDAFFVNYTIGADIADCGDYDPAAVMAASATINEDKGLSASSGSGSLTVGPSSMMPSGGTLPKGATGVNVLKFDVMNGGSAALPLDSLTVRRTGPGEVDDFDAVYVYHGNDRLSNGRTLSGSSQETTFGNLGVSVGPGATESFWLAVDVDNPLDVDGDLADAGNVNAFQIVGLTSGTVSAAGTPVTGPSFTFAGVNAGQCEITDGGAVADIKAGEMGAKIGEFQLEATNEDAHFTRIAVEVGGVNAGDLSNFVLKQSGDTLATVAGLNDDLAVFILPAPFSLEDGSPRTFDLYADVSAAVDTNDVVRLDLDQVADLLCVGQSYGYGMATLDSWTPGDVGIEAGKLTAVLNGPASRDIATGASDVELLNITLSAQANLEVRNTGLTVTIVGGSNVNDVITDLKIVDTATGVTIAGPANTYNGVVEQDFDFTESYNIGAGSSRTLSVRADIEDAAGIVSDTVMVTWGDDAEDDLFNTGDVRNLDNGEDLDEDLDFVPATRLAGNDHGVVAPELTVATGSTPVAQTFIQGSTGVEVFGFGLTANDASDLYVDTITITGDDSSVVLDTVVMSGSLWNGSTQLGSLESPNTNEQFVFDNLNLLVPAGQTVGVTLKVDLRSSLGGLVANLEFDIDGGDLDGDVEDAEGEPLAATQIVGLPADGPNHNVALAGNLNVVRAPEDADTEAGIVVGGTSNAVLAKYKFTAENEEINVEDIVFTVVNGEAVGSLSLWDGSTLVGGPVGVTAGGVADFSSMTFVVPKDSHKTMTVKGNLNSVGASGADTGMEATVTMVETNFEARGTGSGSNTVLDGDNLNNGAGLPSNQIDGYVKVSRKSKPSVALVSLPGSLLTAGDVTASRFTVSADAAGAVALKGLVFEVQNQSNGNVDPVGTKSSVRRVGGDYIDGNVTVYSTDTDANCEDGEECTFAVVFDQEEVISAGSQVTYDLILDVANASTGTDSLSTKLLGDDAADTGDLDYDGVANGYSLLVDDTGSRFVWSDISLLAHDDLDDGSADWANGFYVNVLPTDSQTMSN